MKPLYTSKTVQGLMVLLVLHVASACGLKLSNDIAQQVVTNVTALVAIFWGLYGRAVASSPVGIGAIKFVNVLEEMAAVADAMQPAAPPPTPEPTQLTTTEAPTMTTKVTTIAAPVIALLFLCSGLGGCAAWNAGVSSVNTYSAAEITAQKKNLEGIHDNSAAAWAAAGCAIPYGELVRNGSGNPNLPQAVVALCGAPSGMSLTKTAGTPVTQVSAGDGAKQ